MKRAQRASNGNAAEVHFTSLEPVRVPVVCFVGASRSADDSPIHEWREIRPIRGARPSDRFCAARISGESLADESIVPGDYAIIRLTFEQYEMKPGRLAAVQTPFGLLIKRVYVTLDDKIRLVSANSLYQDIVLDAADVDVQGLVVRIERDLQ